MLVQANARVPEHARQLLLAVAARLRDDEKFHDTLEAFLSDATASNPFADRLDAIEARLAAVEAGSAGKPEGEEIIVDIVHVDNAPKTTGKPKPAPVAGDWEARAAAITISTGEGKGRRFTDEGNALFDEMVRAGVARGEIAHILGMSNQLAYRRAQRVTR